LSLGSKLVIRNYLKIFLEAKKKSRRKLYKSKEFLLKISILRQLPD